MLLPKRQEVQALLHEKMRKDDMAKRKNKKQAASHPGPIRWEFDPDIPTDDFFDRRNLNQLWDLQEAVDNFVSMVDGDTFLAWEAVVCEEQGRSLTAKQKKALGKLLSFNDEEDDEILYIDEIARPSEPWYAILNKIAPHLLIEPYRTFDCHEEVRFDGWNRIATALREHGQGLSLPRGVKSPEEVVPADLRHKLWQQWCKDSVAYFGLTLESLMTKVIVPEKDQPIFVKIMLENLGLNSLQEPITNHL
jgi:hypothetical protein